MQGRRQNSVTGGGGGRIIFLCAREVHLCEFESVDQTKKVKNKEKRSSVQKCPQIFIFILRFSTNSKVKTKKKNKKRSLSQKFHKIRCESTKTTKKLFLLANSRTIRTNLGILGLDLHSSCPEPVNFFGHCPRLGVHKRSFAGYGPRMPLMAPGLH